MNFAKKNERILSRLNYKIEDELRKGLCRLFYFASLYAIIHFVCENKHKEESWSRFH